MSRSWSVAGLWQPALVWPRLHRVEARGRLRRMMAKLAPFGFIYLGILVDAVDDRRRRLCLSRPLRPPHLIAMSNP